MPQESTGTTPFRGGPDNTIVKRAAEGAGQQRKRDMLAGRLLDVCARCQGVK